MQAQMQMQDPNYQLDDWNLGLNNPFTSFLPFAPAYQNVGANHLEASHSTSTTGGPSSSSDYPSINIDTATATAIDNGIVTDSDGAAAATAMGTSGPSNVSGPAAAAQDIDMSGTSTNSMNTNMNIGMDYIDWAFLDQWMALPNPTNGISLAENQMLFDIPSAPSAPAAPAKDSFHPQTQQQPGGLNANGNASGETEAPDWTSTPYRFLGGEILLKNDNAAAAEDARTHDRTHARKAEAEAGQRRYENENGMDNSRANQY
jgi:hypothetical protein